MVLRIIQEFLFPPLHQPPTYGIRVVEVTVCFPTVIRPALSYQPSAVKLFTGSQQRRVSSIVLNLETLELWDFEAWY